MNSTFRSARVQDVLARLHADSRKVDDTFRQEISTIPPEAMRAAAKDYRFFYGKAEKAYMAIDEGLGRLLYALLRSSKAKNVVEFGTSFGISTLYLASAVWDNGGGRVVTCEFLPSKAEAARKSFEEAGLAEVVEVRIGDALESLAAGVSAPLDAVFLDGAKQLYLPVLKLLEPSLRSGALITADNMDHDTAAAFAAYIRDPENGYESVNVPGKENDSFEIAVRV